MKAGLHLFLHAVLIFHPCLATDTHHQCLLLILVVHHVFLKQFVQSFLGTLKAWLTVLIKLFLDFEVSVHTIFLGLQGNIGLYYIDEAIDVFTLFIQHVDGFRQHCLTLR
jgi:hypothetical protein